MVEICRRTGVSEATFYRRKKKISWYGRVRQGRLAQIVEEVGEFLRPKEAEVVTRMYRQAVGAEQESAIPLNNRKVHSFKMVETAGIEPAALRDRVLHLRC